MKNWDTREKCERGTHQIIVVALPGYGSIGIHSLQNGVVKLIILQRKIFINLIVTLINELLKQRHILLTKNLANRKLHCQQSNKHYPPIPPMLTCFHVLQHILIHTHIFNINTKLSSTKRSFCKNIEKMP